MSKVFNEEMSFPRWGIYGLDILFAITSFYCGFLLRFNFDVPDGYWADFLTVLPYYFIVRTISFFAFKSYSGIIQYTSVDDAIRIFYTVITGTIILTGVNITSYLISDRFIIPLSVIIIDAIALILFMTALRLVVKALYLELMNSEKELKNVVIYGVDSQAIITKKTLERDLEINYNVVGFISDSKKYASNKLEGQQVIIRNSEFKSVLEKKKVDLLIFSHDDVDKELKSDLVDTCLAHNVKVLNVPPSSSWINGELSFKQIKELKIEDLLGRKPIKLDKSKISADLEGRVVLVTGAAGSIGSEIVRQILPFNPKKVYILDQAESPLYEFELELKEKFRDSSFEVVISNVKNKDRMENVFKTFKPDFVFHAAAYKHVPLMENNPSEAILTNVLGTKVCADLSVKYGVKKFVLISTDKAVNPTNVMGASKRLAEIYVQSLDTYGSNKKTRFVTTRFGNVLGSNGSVIPLFRKQIMNGGPVTVTHPEITRFFMTIPEACQLVLEAGSMGKGGEVFLFDMGDSIKIVDLAKKMIKLSGLELGKDIQLSFTGLRPGEKLYEELLMSSEDNIPTHNEKIMIGKVREYSFVEVNKELSSLVDLFGSQDNLQIVAKMKALVPEFRSNNSEYEELDMAKQVN